MGFCTQTLGGIQRDCCSNKGGIREAYIANFAEGAFSVSTGGSITAVTSAVSFYHYTFNKDTGSFTSTLNVDAANGINYVSSEINLIFSRMETLKRLEIAALSLGDLMMIIKDANGKLWAFGTEEPVNASAGTAESGVARGDRNGYSITFVDNSASYPMEVTAEAFAGLTIVEPSDVTGNC